MNRPRVRTLLALTTAAGAAAAIGLVRAEKAERRRLGDDPEYVELTRPVGGEPHLVVSRDGTHLHAEVFGPQGAPTVVLVHGWTCQLRMWHPQMVELCRNLRVVAYDQRGHGESEMPKAGAFSTEALADDLAAVLDACVPAHERVLLAGHSMGAMSILAWAQRHPDDVGRAAAAALMSTGVGDLVAESLLFPLIPRTLVRTRRLIGAGLLTAPLDPPSWLAPITREGIRHIALSTQATEAEVAFCHDIVAACPREARVGWGQVLLHLDLAAAIDRLRTPTLVMVGERDRLTPPTHARRLESALPEAAGLVVVPGAGHMLPLEAADEVNRRLRELARDRLGARAEAS